MTAKRVAWWWVLATGAASLFSTVPVLAADASAEYEARAAKLADGDAKGWLALADFAEEHLLLPQREAALRKVVAVAPDHAEARRRLDEVKVGGEWVSGAEADARAGKEHEGKGEVFYGKAWVSAAAAGRLRAADRGRFAWPIQTRVDAPPYCAVYSAVGYAEARAVAVVVHRVTTGYEAVFGKGRKLTTFAPFPVHLFGSADVFAREFKRMGKLSGDVPKGFAGSYTPTVKMMFLSTDIGSPGWNQEALLHTVAHETLHALDELAAGISLSAVPTWIAEGRAIYSQYSLVGRQWIPGALNVSGTDGRGQEVEKAYKTASLERLLGLDQKAFMQNAAANYAVAWSFTHFLLHGKEGKHRDRFLRFLAGCPARSSAKDFERIVGKVAELEAPYKEYVETLFLPAVKASVNADRKAKGLPGEWK
ncbi:MAG: DUF1570 domain-containing protein [Planctomycetes bacterium]|nr:DUF1570 domain-containing protein [Planctomycetota bacterium]